MATLRDIIEKDADGNGNVKLLNHLRWSTIFRKFIGKNRSLIKKTDLGKYHKPPSLKDDNASYNPNINLPL